MNGISRKQKGFTIVELLIVIVVIGILAAITIVAYNGVQRRANNTAIISAAGQTIDAIRAYHIANDGAYPAAGDLCVSSLSGCAKANGDVINASVTFESNIADIARVPKSVPNQGTVSNGIRYHYASDRQFEGVSSPVLILYYLNGTNQDCKLSRVMNNWGTPTSATASTNGNSGNASGGKTICYISIPA